MATVVLGAQWGDEGKGKLVDILCDDAEICARCQGGNNAGHTIVVNGVKYDFHMLPSGLINERCLNLVGSGVVVHLKSFFAELEQLEAKGLTGGRERLFVSDRAQLVFDFHQRADGLREAELSGNGKQIGTTGRGIGPAYSTKAIRSGLRVHHLVSDVAGAWEEFERVYNQMLAAEQQRFGGFEYDSAEELARFREYRETLRPMVVDAVPFMHDALDARKKVLIEGANALMLDIDHGTYPFVTSSNTGIGGVCTGLGVPPTKIGDVIGVVKAYTTRVGAGPFPTEQLNDVGTHLQEVGAEWGVTTGRRRRCGWLDLVVLRHSTLVNGYTKLNITKLDVLDDFAEVKVATAYKYKGKTLPSFPANLSRLETDDVEIVYDTLPGWQKKTSEIRRYSELPPNALKYLEYIERFVGVPIVWVGVGAGRDAMLTKE